jgi:acetolactate synthase-1/2/3 large subunit
MARHPQSAEQKGKCLEPKAGSQHWRMKLLKPASNPRMSAVHFLAALENSRIRSVLCLFEGVATGAADGWYQMRDHPASMFLHLRPGLTNGLANIHKARRARSGMINIVGDHNTAHLKYDPPLSSDISDIEGLARLLSHWVRRAHSLHSVAGDASAAIAQARSIPGRIATLILPGETSCGDSGDAENSPAGAVTPAPKPPDWERGEPALIVLAGRAARGRALKLAGRIAAYSGCRIATQFFTARVERGSGRVPLERIPYYVPAAMAFLEGFKYIVTVETGEPVAFLSYPGKPSLLNSADCSVHSLVAVKEDSVAGLEMLVEALGADQAEPPLQTPSNLGKPEGQLNPKSIAQALAAALPENSILVDESLTTGRETLGLALGACPHDLLQNLGGSIGSATPVATGAAGRSRPPHFLYRRRRNCRVYCSVALDAGARGAECHDHHRRQQFLSDSEVGVRQHKFWRAWTTSFEVDRHRHAEDRLRANGQKHGLPFGVVENAANFYTSMINSAREPAPMLIEVRLSVFVSRQRPERTI